MVKIVEYRGVVYRRYEGRLYYNPSGTLLAHGSGTSLHRQVWLDAGNTIPDGWHIHHKDGDHDNNRLDNLECLPAEVHLSEHARERLQPGGDLRHARQQWGETEKGKRILRCNAAKMLASTPERQSTCEYCATAFVTRHPTQRYCSKACAEAVPNTQCEICGVPFRSKPHSTKRVKTCSYSCGWALRRKNAGL